MFKVFADGRRIGAVGLLALVAACSNAPGNSTSSDSNATDSTAAAVTPTPTPSVNTGTSITAVTYDTSIGAGVDANGFAFYTDYRSRKGAELAENPLAALTFLWKEIERQVRITGSVSRVSVEESEAYFRTRPPGSRLGAWASHQSAVLASREELEARVQDVAGRFPDGDVPLPPHWGGFRVTPDEIEFWQGRPSRLHDRLLYRGGEGGWEISRLSP